MKYEMFNYPYTMKDSSNGLEIIDLNGSVIITLPNNIEQYKDDCDMIDEDAVICEISLYIEVEPFVFDY